MLEKCKKGFKKRSEEEVEAYSQKGFELSKGEAPDKMKEKHCEKGLKKQSEENLMACSHKGSILLEMGPIPRLKMTFNPEKSERNGSET